MKYDQVVPGEWIKLKKSSDFRMMCCDCSLVHKVKFKIVGSSIWLRMWQDNRATGQARRKK